MRALVLVAVMATACSSSSADRKSDPPPGKPAAQQAETSSQPPGAGQLPGTQMSTGRQHVKGGESFTLRGPVTVTVNKVVYVNQPCPAGTQCITSGIIKLVQVAVRRQGGAAESASVALGAERVVGGVQVRVLDVQPGPSADIEASLPVGGS